MKSYEIVMRGGMPAWRAAPRMRILIGADCPCCGAGWLAFYEHCSLCVLREAEVCRG